jgi:uncharacterized membrane protein
MKTLAVVAGAIHGLSLSVAYGGPVFAKVGLRPALKKITSKEERHTVMQTAWSKFSKVNVPAHVGFTASWVILRSMLRNVYVDRETKRLLVAKDVLIAGALLTGVAATITGKAMKRAYPTKPAKGARAGEAQRGTEAKHGETSKAGESVRIGETHKAGTKAEKRASTTRNYNKLRRLEKTLGRANMAFVAASIIISPAIAAGIFRSQRMGLIARIFNR